MFTPLGVSCCLCKVGKDRLTLTLDLASTDFNPLIDQLCVTERIVISRSRCFENGFDDIHRGLWVFFFWKTFFFLFFIPPSYFLKLGLLQTDSCLWFEERIMILFSWLPEGRCPQPLLYCFIIFHLLHWKLGFIFSALFKQILHCFFLYSSSPRHLQQPWCCIWPAAQINP